MVSHIDELKSVYQFMAASIHFLVLIASTDS
jgi:hypothetical protein